MTQEARGRPEFDFHPYEQLSGGRLEEEVATAPSWRVAKPKGSRRRQWPTTTWAFSAPLGKQLAEAEPDLLREMVKTFYPGAHGRRGGGPSGLWSPWSPSAFVKGVSTRRVDSLVKTLGIEHIAKSQVSEMAKSLDEEVAAFRSRPLDAGPYPYLWLDALAVRVREGRRIVRCPCVVATGVSADDCREILGMDTYTTEGKAAWRVFRTHQKDLNVGDYLIDDFRTAAPIGTPASSPSSALRVSPTGHLCWTTSAGS